MKNSTNKGQTPITNKENVDSSFIVSGLSGMKCELQKRRYEWKSIRTKKMERKKELINQGMVKKDVKKDKIYKKLEKEQKHLSKQIKHIEKRFNRALARSN